MKELDRLKRPTESQGALRSGKGLIIGVIALSLAMRCSFGVLASPFPEDLGTPQLRESRNGDVLRQAMFWAMVLAGASWLIHVINGRARRLVLAAFVLMPALVRAPIVVPGFGKEVIVTPHVHHGHQAQGNEAIDRNRAARDRHHVVGDGVANGFFKQLAFAFRGKR